MGMIGSLLRSLSSRVTGARRSTPAEIRELVDRGELNEAWACVEALAHATPDRTLVALCLRGEIAFRQRRDDEAENYFREALAQAPGYGEAHYGLSLLMHARGDKETALRHAQFAVNKTKAARASAQLGLCQLELGNFGQAESALSRATRIDPNDKWSWNNLGITLRARGNPRRAQEAFQRALEIDVGFQQAASNLNLLRRELDAAGMAQASGRTTGPVAEGSDGGLAVVRQLTDASKFDDAIEACEELCAARPNEGELAIELFRVYRASGDAQSGIDVLQAFHARVPEDVDVLSELGRALVREHEFKAAKPLVTQALELRPDDVSLLACMADIRTEQQRHEDAGTLLERACELDSRVDLKGKLAANLIMRCQYDRALDVVDEILVEQPLAAEDVAGIQIYAMTHLGRHDEALPLLERAIALNPNEPNRRFPRATIHLLNERFDVGWDDYAYRNLSSTQHLRMPPFPEWQGEPLSGKTILVLADQGLGDQVMFASCLPDLLALAPARTIVEVNLRAAKTIARSFPTCQVIHTRQDNELDWIRELGTVDYFVAIGDLPRHFRRSRDAFPLHSGYLRADPARVEHWRERLASLGKSPKIGISWRGGTEHTRKVLRTIDVPMLSPLFESCNADWVCLQYGDVTKELEAAKRARLPIHYWAESIKDLDEFAALISALDMVITVCNTTVHYAGAIGKPVWIMAPRIPEWRYGLHSSQLPWYPSSRIYRQAHDGDWTSVLSQISRDLSLQTS